MSFGTKDVQKKKNILQCNRRTRTYIGMYM